MFEYSQVHPLVCRLKASFQCRHILPEDSRIKYNDLNYKVQNRDNIWYNRCLILTEPVIRY